MRNLLPCPISEFPCNNLGLPLSVRKLSRAHFQTIVDRVASHLPVWKAELMTKAGRATYVQFVMKAKMIYASLALDLLAWAIKAIDKLRKGFLWRGRKEANVGHCLLAWSKVTRPKDLGGLGISDPLQKILELATERGLLSKIRGRSPCLRLSLYADDAALFIAPKKRRSRQY